MPPGAHGRSDFRPPEWEPVTIAMRRALRLPSITSILTAAAVVFTAWAIRAEPPTEDPPPTPEFPAGVGKAYRILSDSILAEEMPTFMKIFHINFIYEATDGAAMDRGPWRRLWLDRFADRIRQAHRLRHLVH